MTKLCILTFFIVSVAVPLLAISGEDPPPQKKEWGMRIFNRGSVNKEETPKEELCVLDGDLMLVAFRVYGQSPGGPNDPPLPHYSLRFVLESLVTVRRDGLAATAKLRVKLAPRPTNLEHNYSKALLAKDGWYVTADFSTDPPQVILTERPEKGSRWALVDADVPGRYLIKNEDAAGKAVWLTMEKEGKTYRGGIARKPILSEQKDRYWIGDADSGR